MATAIDTPSAPLRASASVLIGLRQMLQPGLCFVSAGLVAFAAARSGGYFPEDYLLIGAVALVGCAAGLAGAGPQWRPTPTALFALVCITGFAVWTGLSAAWSPDPGGASLAMARTLGYAAAFLLAMLAVGNGRHAALLLRLLVLVLVGLGMLALLGRLRPDLFAGGSNVTYPAQGRLGSIITYSNGLGAVSAMAVIGAIALASDARELVVTRALAAAGGVLVTCTMYLTLSRGTGIAFAAGLAVILVASPRRGRLAVATLITLGGGLAGILLLRQHPILIDLPGTAAARRAEGGPLVGKLLLVAMAAGGLQAAFARLQRSREGSSRVAGRPSRSTPPVLAAAPIIVILLALAGTYLAVGARVEGGANSAGSGVQSFLDRQYVSFMNPVSAAPQGQDRLISAQSSRSDAYRVALDGLRAHPIAGDGAAGYRVRWFRQRRGLEDLRNAHSLELETLSELGVVGGVLLLGFLGSLLFGLRSMVRRRGTITRTQAAGAGGILVVWVMHSALDWDWQLAAVTLPALICGALCLAPDRPPVPPAPPRAASPGAR